MFIRALKIPFMKTARILSTISAIFGFLTLLRSPSGITGGLLWLPKLWAQAWAPFLALMGILGAMSGWLNKDCRALWAGLLGAILGIRYTHKVAVQPDHFASAFGSDWHDRIPSNLRARLPSKRYRLVQPAIAAIPGRHDLVIGSSGAMQHPLLCDIWEPALDVPRTGLAIIYFHGGLWQAFDKDFLTQSLFRRLVSQGHIIMDVAYSLSPESDLDSMLGDVKQAIAWMKTNSVKFAVDPERIVLMGVSGGAHLALLAAYAPAHPAFQQVYPDLDASVRAVVSISGITDLRAFFHEYGQANPRQPQDSSQISEDLRPRRYDKSWLDRFLTRSRVFPVYRHGNMPGGPLLLVYLLGGTLNEAPDVYRLASPLVYVGPNSPPTLLIHGEDDFIINVSHARRLHQALVAAGAVSVYNEIPNTVHAFDQYFGVSRRVAPAAQSATYDIERFLALMV